VAAMLAAAGAFAQEVYVGFKGGTPFSDSRLSTFIGGRGGSGPYRLDVRRYTVGPTVEVTLPLFGIAVEVDALYKRFDTEEHRFMSPSFGTIIRTNRNSWEFPMQLRRAWRIGRVAPFASAGGVFRVVPGSDQWVESFSGFPGVPDGIVRRFSAENSLVQGGWVAGGGVRSRAIGRVSLTPEFRWTWYTSPRLLPAQHQVEFLLGIGLSNRR
jgi:hypothetical protein